MASHSRNKSTSTATSGPIPMPKSESFCDKIIGICAGRHARERVDRARWLRYFQSLPDTTHDEPAALAASFKQTTISSSTYITMRCSRYSTQADAILDYSSFSSVFTCPQSSSISIQSPATTINSGKPHLHTQNYSRPAYLMTCFRSRFSQSSKMCLYCQPPKGPRSRGSHLPINGIPLRP